MSEFGGIRALAFDYFGTVGDKQGLATIIDELIGGSHGAALAKLWFQTCQRYCFQNGMMGRYLPWNELSRRALDFASAELGVPIPADKRDALLLADQQVPIYGEAPAALQRLSKKFSLHVLSMGAPWMIERSQKLAGIDTYFSSIITTEPDKVYKPARVAYDIGVREIGRPAHEIGFVSGNSFDVIGSKNYGFATFWVRRYGQPLDDLGLEPDLIVTDLARLADELAA